MTVKCPVRCGVRRGEIPRFRIRSKNSLHVAMSTSNSKRKQPGIEVMR